MRRLASSRSVWYCNQICLSQWFSIAFYRDTSGADAVALRVCDRELVRSGRVISIDNPNDHSVTERDRDANHFWDRDRDFDPRAYVSLITFGVYEHLFWRTCCLRFPLLYYQF